MKNNYTKLISRNKQYKYSVNICFDLYNEDCLASFIPNAATAKIIRELIGPIISGKSDIHSRILYGSYGTGKSHLLTVISAVLGHINTESSGFDHFIELLSKYDEELSYDIQEYVRTDKAYLVVPVYSDYSDFGKCVIFSIKKELERNGIPVCFKGFYDEAAELLERWQKGEESSERLKNECSKIGIEVSDLKKGLASYEISCEKKFRAIYEGMSYGASFNSTAGSLIDNLNAANEAVKTKYRGIVLIFDEFGRYVEDFGEELKVKSIQDLAEYCDHSDYDNYIILASHRQLSLYTSSMKKNASNEWKKIEGRFKSVSINAKYDQCFSLIGNVIPKTSLWRDFKNRYDKELNDLYTQAWYFKEFKALSDNGEENLLENGFPLHPITLFALDRLSKKVAQNERTFFTYLSGDDDNSLYAQLEKFDLNEFHFIGLDAIYDYFELNIKSFKTDEAYDVYKKLQYAINKIDQDNDGYQKKVLKSIAVIDIISDMNDLAADRNTLLNVIDGRREDISSAINILENRKIIKFMRQYGYYDFFDSSIYDLEGMIEDRLSDISEEMVINVLNEKFSFFALYPYRYNETYFINRVFIPVFAEKDDLTKKSFYSNLPKYYDGAAVFVLDNQAEETEYKNIDGLPPRVILLVNGNAKTLETEVKRYIAVNYFFSKKEELAQEDPTVVDELRLYLHEQESIVAEMLKKWCSFEEPGTFMIFDGEVVESSSEKELSEIMSEMMESSFNRTLMVNNDLINKNSLTAVMKISRRKVLRNIIQYDDVYQDCRFLSPEFNILRSVLSKNGIIDNDSVRKQARVSNEELNRFPDGTIPGGYVMSSISTILKKAETKRLSLIEVYSMLKNEPYGLRDGYIPVLVAYALRNYQNVSLYFHGNELSYNENELVKALTDPYDYSILLLNWNDEQIAYIETLEKIFEGYLPEGDSLNRLEKLFKAMNSHFASVSKSARTTEIFVSDNTRKYREIMSLSYTDYNYFFFSVLPEINSDLQELAQQIKMIKDELESVSAKQLDYISHIVMNVFNVSGREDLMQHLQKLYQFEWKAKRDKAFDYTTNAVLDLVSKAGGLSEESFIRKLAKIVTGFEIEYWTDEKIADFKKKLEESVNKINYYKPDEILKKGETKITIESGEGDQLVSQFSEAELSPVAETMLNKLKNTLNSFGASISYEQKISIMAELLKEIINNVERED